MKTRKLLHGFIRRKTLLLLCVAALVTTRPTAPAATNQPPNLAALAASVIASNAVPKATWKLKWTVSEDPLSAGTAIHWRQLGASNYNVLRLGQVNTFAITNLVATNRYEAFVTAYNGNAAQESLPSNTAHYPPDVIYTFTADTTTVLESQWTTLYTLGTVTNYFGVGNATNAFYRAAVREERR